MLRCFSTHCRKVGQRTEAKALSERVEEVVEGKRHIADLVLPKSSSLADLDADQLRVALGLRPETLLTEASE